MTERSEGTNQRLNLMTLKNLNLGVAQTVCIELKTIRSLKVRIDKYTKYARYNKLMTNYRVTKLIKGLKYIYSKLTQSGEGTSCYSLPNYTKLRITVDKILKGEGTLWENSIKKPYLNHHAVYKDKSKEDRLLSIRLKSLESGKNEARKAELKWRLTQEILEKNEKHWYIVFNTLTVDPWNYSKVWENGTLTASKPSTV